MEVGLIIPGVPPLTEKVHGLAMPTTMIIIPYGRLPRQVRLDFESKQN